jgi:hypothetical protein
MEGCLKIAKQDKMDYMLSAQVANLLAQITHLKPEERRELFRRLDQNAVNGSTIEVMTEDEFEKALLNQGMISSLPTRDHSLTTPPSLIKVSGPPLSETIISERR